MNITITLHDNSKHTADIPDYTAKTFASLINENPHEVIIFGDGGIVKHAIKYFYPTESNNIKEA